MRTAFIEQLIIEARRNPRIFLVVGDLGFSVVEPFAREFPDRYLNAGVAEQNMTGVAAGLASEGYHVFTYSIANFPTFRCAEQIRNDIAYHNLAVTVVAVGGGVAYGNLGYSHHAVQDLALMRSFPGMLMACPGDPHETRELVTYLSGNPRPSYLRLGKAGEPAVHQSAVTIKPGKPLWLIGEKECQNIIITTGAALKTAELALRASRARNWALGSLPLWGEPCNEIIVRSLRGKQTIVTIEDHLRSGGFGSYIRELLDDENLRPSFKSIALNNHICGHAASQAQLSDIGGLTTKRIVDLISI